MQLTFVSILLQFVINFETETGLSRKRQILDFAVRRLLKAFLNGCQTYTMHWQPITFKSCMTLAAVSMGLALRNALEQWSSTHNQDLFDAHIHKQLLNSDTFNCV